MGKAGVRGGADPSRPWALPHQQVSVPTGRSSIHSFVENTWLPSAPPVSWACGDSLPLNTTPHATPMPHPSMLVKRRSDYVTPPLKVFRDFLLLPG